MKAGQPELTSQYSGSEKNLEGDVRDSNAHPPDRKVEVTGLHQNQHIVAPSEDANMTDLEVSRHVNSNVNSVFKLGLPVSYGILILIYGYISLELYRS